MQLEGASAVVTGGANGIGLAVGRELYRQGAHILLVDNNLEMLQRAQTQLTRDEQANHGQISTFHGDVRSIDEMERAAQEAVDRFGRLDLWINNAGLARHMPVDQTGREDIDLVIDVNLKGTIYGSRAAFRHMKAGGRGHIINVISTASLRGIPTESVYCSAKWGVRGFTHALQEEAAPHRVRVTAILPGGVSTDFWSAARDSATPLESFLKPEHVAKVIRQCIEQDEFCVTREVVVRSIADTDFAYGKGEQDE